MKSVPIRHVFQLSTLILILSACEPSHTVEEYIQRAQEAQSKGDAQASLIELKNAAQKAPENAQVRLLLAQHYIRSGEGDEAEKELKRARDLGQNWEGLKALHADALLQQGKFQRVLDEVAPSLATSRADRASILRAQGDAKLGMGQTAQGCPMYAEAIKVDPKQVAAYWGLAKCALLQHSPEESRAQLQAALQVAPNEAGTWINLGNLERWNNNLDAALQAYSTALKHEPGNLESLLARAQIYASTDKIDAAQKDLAQLKKINPRYYGTHFVEAMLHYAGGRLQPALDSAAQALRGNPGYPPTHLLVAHVLYEQKSYERVVKVLTQFVQSFPRHLDARKLLAATYLRLNQPDRTLELLNPYLVSGKGDTQVLALAAEAQLRQSDPLAASELYGKAVDQAGENPVLNVKLGLSLLAGGSESRGIDTLQSAAHGTDDPRASIALAYYLLSQRRFDQAIAVLADVEKKLPDNPGTHNLKGMAYTGKGDVTRARQSFERALTLKPDLTSAAVRLAVLDLRENKIQAARARYEALLKHDKANVPAMVGLAEVAAVQKRDDEQLVWLERSLKADPAALVPRTMLANYHLSRNRPLEALRHAREAAERNPHRSEAIALLGRVQLAAGERENALSTLTKLSSLAPKSSEAFYLLAQAQAALGKEQATREALGKALELNPGQIPARAALSKLEGRSGRMVEALRHARELQKRAPSSSLGFALEGDALLVARRPADAVSAYQKGLARERNTDMVVKTHFALQRAGGAAKADELLIGWLKEHPKDANARAYLAESYQQRGLQTAAQREYETLLTDRPDDAPVLNNLAVLYQQLGDPRALELAEKAHRKQPDNPAFADTLGWLLAQRGETERGLKLLEQALAKAPGNPQVRYHYVQVLLQTDRTAQARQELARLQAMALPPALQHEVAQLAKRVR
jgi:putative PEP-CTERM system TPR-repeat lipoprotein